MKFYGRAKQVTESIMQAFQEGRIASPLATIYLRRNDHIPMGQWSALNQLSCLLAGCLDARGYEQWRQVGRFVRKGENAQAHILIPLMRKADDGDDESGRALYGFKSCPVFDVSQTDGEPLPDEQASHPHQAFLDALPLVDVAKAWNLHLDTYSGRDSRAKGYFVRRASGKSSILLGVENINTWLHELVHAADYRCGNLTENGQHWRSETVAQLGACVLAHMIGCPEYADEGKTWGYIAAYAGEAGIEPLTACTRVVERLGLALDLILTTHEAMTPA